jgi:hypothetical protein|tara:strand:- start:2389 stop:2592 length:204 start_codon:yes stop_codon:yes gene_type:complete
MDHVEDGDTAEEFVVRGTLGKITDESITLIVWDYVDTESVDFDQDDGNRKIFTILRSTITKVRVIPK